MRARDSSSILLNTWTEQFLCEQPYCIRDSCEIRQHKFYKFVDKYNSEKEKEERSRCEIIIDEIGLGLYQILW